MEGTGHLEDSAQGQMLFSVLLAAGQVASEGLRATATQALAGCDWSPGPRTQESPHRSGLATGPKETQMVKGTRAHYQPGRPRWTALGTGFGLPTRAWNSHTGKAEPKSRALAWPAALVRSSWSLP